MPIGENAHANDNHPVPRIVSIFCWTAFELVAKFSRLTSGFGERGSVRNFRNLRRIRIDKAVY